MPIGPISDSHRQISVVEPLSPALEHVKKMLFQPFDLGKWFVIGFCAWLAQLGESGESFNFSKSYNNNNYNGSQGMDQFRHFLEQARDYTLDNLYWIIPLAVVLFVFFIALWMVILWLNSRGKFMFLHCVALDKAEVAGPWNKFAAQGLSLFWFQLALGLVGMVLILPMMGIIGVLILKMVLHGELIMEAILLTAGISMVVIFLAIFFALIHKFTVDFVVPIMYLRGGKCLEAWGEFWGLLCAQPGLFTLYILFQIVIAIAIGMLVVLVIIFTCCLAGCLMMIPYIGTVLLLPVLIFKRSFSLYFLRQFGPAYDVFPQPPSPPTAPTGLQPLPGQPV